MKAFGDRAKVVDSNFIFEYSRDNPIHAQWVNLNYSRVISRNFIGNWQKAALALLQRKDYI